MRNSECGVLEGVKVEFLDGAEMLHVAGDQRGMSYMSRGGDQGVRQVNGVGYVRCNRAAVRATREVTANFGRIARSASMSRSSFRLRVRLARISLSVMTEMLARMRPVPTSCRKAVA